MKSKAAMVAGILDDIRRIFQILTEHSRRIEHETALTPAQFMVIKLLADTSPMKVSDLAKRLYLHPATMVGLLDRLEAKGLVQRSRSAKDRRVVDLCLTEMGQEVVRNSSEAAQVHPLKGLESLSVQHLEKISGGLEYLVEFLGVQAVPP